MQHKHCTPEAEDEVEAPVPHPTQQRAAGQLLPEAW